MISDVSWFTDTAYSGALVLAIPVAFLAGMVSFFSPCILPLLPGYLSYVSGVAVQDLGKKSQWRVVLGVVLFIAGFSAVFIAGGALFGAAGQRLLQYHQELSVIGGLLLILMGLVFIGRVSFMQRQLRSSKVPATGIVAAPLMGVIFGVGWTPCLGPTLIAVLALSSNQATAGRGAFLTAVYCIGLGLPFVVAALFFFKFKRLTDWIKRHQRIVAMTGGALLIVTGVLLATGLWEDIVIQMQHLIGGFETAL